MQRQGRPGAWLQDLPGPLRQGFIHSWILLSIHFTNIFALPMSAGHGTRHQGHIGTKTDTMAALGGQKLFTYLCKCVNTACIRKARGRMRAACQRVPEGLARGQVSHGAWGDRLDSELTRRWASVREC